MKGRFVAAVAILLAAASFTGCIEALSSLSEDESEATAMRNRDLADNAANAWSPGAHLVGLAALEGTNVTEPFLPDADRGNGRAPLWIYTYMTEDHAEMRAFAATAGGQVRALNETIESPDFGEPVTDWVTDSDRAMQLARENATFESIATAEDVFFTEALGSAEGMLAWVIMAVSEEGQAMALVDARNDALVMVQSFEMDFEFPDMGPWMGASWTVGPQVEMQETGTVDASTPQHDYPFSITRADAAMLTLTFDKLVPLDALGWALLTADGERLMGDVVRTEQMSGSDTFEFMIEEPGDYVLAIYYASMLPVEAGSIDYQMHFFVGELPDLDTPMDGS